MSLPLLAALRIHETRETRETTKTRDPIKSCSHEELRLEHLRWLRACNRLESKPSVATKIPPFKPFKELSSEEKMKFHRTVDLSENDRFSMGQYDTPYEGSDVDRVLSADLYRDRWSVEHVLPKLKINGRRPGLAENDWLGWDLATRGANSKRGSLPLVLWPAPSMSVGKVKIPGDVYHFNPLEEHKDRLVRRWMFVRATYGMLDDIDPPSKSQLKHADDIIALCGKTSTNFAEERLGFFIEKLVLEEFETVWTNPLADDDRKHSFLKSELFKQLVFGNEQKHGFDEEATPCGAPSRGSTGRSTGGSCYGLFADANRPNGCDATERC